MHSIWKNQNDFMEDIWALSEIEGVGSHEVEEPTPASILEYRAQMEANNTGSVYDSPFHDENVTYIISGRGRGGISTILRPGVSQLSDSLVTEDVQRKIRQVSGLGYSNALIEQGVKAMTIANSKTKDSPITSQTSSPSKKSPNKTLDLCSPIDNERSSSSCSSLSSNSPLAVATEDAAGPPPPLSVMRKKAQKQRLKNKQKTFEEVSVKDVKKAEELPRKNAKSCSGSSSPWQNSGSSSDEGSWRRRDGSSANRFFKQPSNGFTVNCNDFPALK